MESHIKIRASLNRMKQEFSKGNSPYYFIKYYNGTKDYKNNDNEPIIFECLIRHNEIGNRKIERSTPYTFETLESTLERKCKEYEEEQQDNELYLLDHILYKHKIYDITLDYDENKNIVAKDDDNIWKGKEFYDFLYDEVFVYNSQGMVDLLTREELRHLDEYRKKYEISNEKELNEEIEK